MNALNDPVVAFGLGLLLASVGWLVTTLASRATPEERELIEENTSLRTEVARRDHHPAIAAHTAEAQARILHMPGRLRSVPEQASALEDWHVAERAAAGLRDWDAILGEIGGES